MALAALIVSILGLLVAVSAALYARSISNVEKARRHDEVAPVFTAQFDMRRWAASQPTPVPVVAFSFIAGPDQLDDVDVEMILRSEGQPPPLIAIAPTSKYQEEIDGRQASLTADTNVVLPLLRGQERLVLAARHVNEGGGSVPFTVRSRHGEARWSTTIECDVPGVPRLRSF